MCAPVRACPGALACTCGCAHVALLIKQATRMRHIVTSFVTPVAQPHFLTFCHKRHDFRKMVTERTVCVLIFSTNFVYNISHSKDNLARCSRTCDEVFMGSTCYLCRLLKKLQFSRQVFEETSNIKFHQNHSSGSRVVPYGRTDGHNESNSRFSQLWKTH